VRRVVGNDDELFWKFDEGPDLPPPVETSRRVKHGGRLPGLSCPAFKGQAPPHARFGVMVPTPSCL
jgi:hypothetical protein